MAYLDIEQTFFFVISPTGTRHTGSYSYTTPKLYTRGHAIRIARALTRRYAKANDGGYSIAPVIITLGEMEQV